MYISKETFDQKNEERQDNIKEWREFEREGERRGETKEDIKIEIEKGRERKKMREGNEQREL